MVKGEGSGKHGRHEVKLQLGHSSPTPKMADLSRLRSALVAALSPGSGDQELFDQLVTHTNHLSNLFDVGPRSTQEQHELESGA